MEKGEVFVECWETFPTLYFMFGEHWVEVLQEDYIIDWSDRGDRSLCHMLIFPSKNPNFLLGLPLFQGYYAHHDMDNSAIGLIPHRRSMKSYILPASGIPT